MKKLLIAGLFSMSVVMFGNNFTNFNGEFSQTVYSFELLRKISDKAGYFTPCWFQLDTENKGHGRKIQHRSNGKLDKTIIVVGYDLSRMADGNVFSLKRGQTLYQIGIHSNPSGRTYEVYSFNKDEKPVNYLNLNRQSNIGRSSSATILCPHCGKELRLVPVQKRRGRIKE